LPYLIWGVAANLLLVAGSLYLLLLFSRERKQFPTFIIGLYIFLLLCAVVDMVMSAQVVEAISPGDGVQAIGRLGRTLVACCIWIPYFLVSKRVKNTFVR
jgi:hypothetical protein